LDHLKQSPIIYNKVRQRKEHNQTMVNEKRISAFAAEATPVKQVEPIVEVAPAKTTTNLKI